MRPDPRRRGDTRRGRRDCGTGSCRGGGSGTMRIAGAEFGPTPWHVAPPTRRADPSLAASDPAAAGDIALQSCHERSEMTRAIVEGYLLTARAGVGRPVFPVQV